MIVETTMHDQSDASLLDARLAGDRAAGRVLFERHFEAVARFFSLDTANDVLLRHRPRRFTGAWAA